MQKLLPWCLALLLAALSASVHAQSAAQDRQESIQDIERLVETLEDPESRARLIGELDLLLEAQRAGQAAQGGRADNTASGLVDTLKSLAIDTWEELTAVDPQTIITSSITSIGILAAALVLRWLLMSLLRRFYTRLRDGSPGESGDGDETRSAPSERAQSALPPTVSRLVNMIIAVLAAALILETWGAGLGGLLRTDIGARILEATLAIGLILIITVALWHASEIIVNRALRLGTRKLDQDRTARRLETLVPLLTSVLQVTIAVFAGLLILSEMGVNIGPLLAGAGILGLAVGFGAQTLVKDLITGVTILLEDSATVGDVVEVAGHSGVVEEMRLRIMQLRDLAGVVHLVPYSDVSAIKNFTKEYSYYLFEVGVAYREDTDEVCKVLMGVSDELCKDEQFGADILEPLEILGVDKFADSAVIIKARIKTQPVRQWAIGREFNRRMKQRFDEAGIEIPFPHSTVYFGEPKEGKAPPARLSLAGSGDLADMPAPGRSGDATA